MRRVTVVLAFLALAACTDSSTQPLGLDAPQPAFSVAVGTTTRITTDPAAQLQPDISGDRIVWSDTRNLSGAEPHNWDIYMYDLATGIETQITTDPAFQAYGRISDDWIVWQDERTHGRGDIYVYDLTTGAEFPITSSGDYQRFPEISGNRVVWQDARFTAYEVFLYDLATGTETRITNDYREQWGQDISGDRIVWYADGVYVYDLATGNETLISHTGLEPAISGERVVWADTRNGNWDIYMYDLATGIETQITTDPAKQMHPSISGDRIVWTDFRHGDSEIYMYDLVSGIECRVTSGLGRYSTSPDISGNRIVWHTFGGPGGSEDIFMFEPVSREVAAIRAIIALVDAFEADGSIGNHGIAESLRAFLYQAEDGIGRGNDAAAVKSLGNFLDQVRRQTPRHITTEAGQTLIDAAQAVIDQLNS